jgi:hypothetical protein
MVDTIANDSVQTGQAVGVEVGVVYPGQPSLTYGFGYADAANKTPFAADTLFEIASNTKVFTTNLLGQAVSSKKLALTVAKMPTEYETRFFPSVPRRDASSTPQDHRVWRRTQYVGLCSESGGTADVAILRKCADFVAEVR